MKNNNIKLIAIGAMTVCVTVILILASGMINQSDGLDNYVGPVDETAFVPLSITGLSDKVEALQSKLTETEKLLESSESAAAELANQNEANKKTIEQYRRIIELRLMADSDINAANEQLALLDTTDYDEELKKAYEITANYIIENIKNGKDK